MNFILSILLLTGFFQQSFQNEVTNQASSYLSNISKEVQQAENYWALNELYEATCKNDNSVIRIIINSDLKRVKKVFTDFSCGSSSEEIRKNSLNRIKQISYDNGLISLAIVYFLKEESELEKETFLNRFTSKWSSSIQKEDSLFLESIAKQDQVDIESIPTEGYELISYSILYTYKARTFFSTESLENLSNQWIENLNNNFDANSLISSIEIANLVFLLYEENKYSLIQETLPLLLSVKLFPHSKERTRHLNATSYSLFVIGRYDESLKVLRDHLIPLSAYLGMKELTDNSTFTKGVNLYSLGKFKEAKEIFEEIYFDSTTTIQKSLLFNNLSICYLKLGEKSKYLNYQLDALREAEVSSSYKDRLIILRNLFIYYTSIKDSKTARLYLERAEKIATENNDSYELAAIHAFSGTFYWEIYQDSDRALQELEIAQAEFNVNTDFVDFVNALKEEAKILVAIDSLNLAKNKFEILKELSIKNSNTPNYLEALIGLTEIHLLNENLPEASRILEEIKIYPLDDLDFELLVKYNTVTASLVSSKGETRKAYEQLVPVIEQVIDRARTSIDSQTGFWSIEAEYIDAFKAVVGMLVKMGDHQKALQFLDELKTINDVALYNSPILRAQRLSEADLALDQLLNAQILSLRTEYLNSPLSDTFSIKSEIDRLSAQREEILNKIRGGIDLKPVSIWTIQNKLSKNEVIIHYTELGDLLYVSYVTRDKVSIETIKFDADTKQLFNSTANLLASSKTDLVKLHEVYKTLNLATNIPKETTSLTVVPDNYLYRLPLDILPTKEPASSISFGSAKYLIEDYDIKYHTSLNDYLDNSRRKKSSSTNDFSAYAVSDFSEFENQNLPSLPYATLEARNIQAELGNFDKKTIFLETEATKASFLEGASNSRIVHVATHSEVSEQDPLFSTIYLTNNSTGKLTSLYAYELFDIKMNNELIMLNSCSSGSGSFLQGSGIMGISRALRYAGANSLALNLWSVNDKAASEFATSFYSNINDGASKYEAIRLAKLSLLKSGNANPYYWGAYMLIGNSAPLTKKPANAGFFFPILFALILTLSFIVREKTSY